VERPEVALATEDAELWVTNKGAKRTLLPQAEAERFSEAPKTNARRSRSKNISSESQVTASSTRYHPVAGLTCDFLTAPEKLCFRQAPKPLSSWRPAISGPKDLCN
jgi:hypothetical protein